MFCWVLAWAMPRRFPVWGLPLALGIEGAWEVAENTEWVIRRYREQTAALGYWGDTVANSLGDLLACGIGFVVARRFPFRYVLAAFVIVEIALVVLIRDSLILSAVMLIAPIDGLKRWQLGQ